MLRGGFKRFDEESKNTTSRNHRGSSRLQDTSAFPLLNFEDSNGISPSNTTERWETIRHQSSEESLEKPTKNYSNGEDHQQQSIVQSNFTSQAPLQVTSHKPINPLPVRPRSSLPAYERRLTRRQTELSSNQEKSKPPNFDSFNLVGPDENASWNRNSRLKRHHTQDQSFVAFDSHGVPLQTISERPPERFSGGSEIRSEIISEGHHYYRAHSSRKAGLADTSTRYRSQNDWLEEHHRAPPILQPRQNEVQMSNRPARTITGKSKQSRDDEPKFRRPGEYPPGTMQSVKYLKEQSSSSQHHHKGLIIGRHNEQEEFIHSRETASTNARFKVNSRQNDLQRSHEASQYHTLLSQEGYRDRTEFYKTEPQSANQHPEMLTTSFREWRLEPNEHSFHGHTHMPFAYPPTYSQSPPIVTADHELIDSRISGGAYVDYYLGDSEFTGPTIHHTQNHLLSKHKFNLPFSANYENSITVEAEDERVSGLTTPSFALPRYCENLSKPQSDGKTILLPHEDSYPDRRRRTIERSNPSAASATPVLKHGRKSSEDFQRVSDVLGSDEAYGNQTEVGLFLDNQKFVEGFRGKDSRTFRDDESEGNIFLSFKQSEINQDSLRDSTFLQSHAQANSDVRKQSFRDRESSHKDRTHELIRHAHDYESIGQELLSPAILAKTPKTVLPEILGGIQGRNAIPITDNLAEKDVNSDSPEGNTEDKEDDLLEKFVKIAAPILQKDKITEAQEESIRRAVEQLGIQLKETKKEKQLEVASESPNPIGPINDFTASIRDAARRLKKPGDIVKVTEGKNSETLISEGHSSQKGVLFISAPSKSMAYLGPQGSSDSSLPPIETLPSLLDAASEYGVEPVLAQSDPNLKMNDARLVAASNLVVASHDPARKPGRSLEGDPTTATLTLDTEEKIKLSKQNAEDLRSDDDAAIASRRPEGTKKDPTQLSKVASPVSKNLPGSNEKPLGATMEEIEFLNRFLVIAGPDFNGSELSVVERDRIHDEALRAGIPEEFLNQLLDQSAGIKRWEERSEFSDEKSTFRKRRNQNDEAEPNTPGDSTCSGRSSLRTRPTLSSSEYTDSMSFSSKEYTFYRASPSEAVYVCGFRRMQSDFWPHVTNQMSDGLVQTVGAVWSGDSESVRSDDASWETGRKNRKPFYSAKGR